jgi:hypothetical protein
MPNSGAKRLNKEKFTCDSVVISSSYVADNIYSKYLFRTSHIFYMSTHKRDLNSPLVPWQARAGNINVISGNGNYRRQDLAAEIYGNPVTWNGNVVGCLFSSIS